MIGLIERILGRCSVEDVLDSEGSIIVASGEIIEEPHLEKIKQQFLQYYFSIKDAFLL